MKQSDILARRRALVTRIQTEGAEAAYEAALAVCQKRNKSLIDYLRPIVKKERGGSTAP